MDKTFTNGYGSFTFNIETNAKIASLFERGSQHITEDIVILEKYITKDSVVVDIGAHIGTMTIPMARLASVVYAFEPMEENIKYLKQNIAQNNIVNAVVHETAVGSRMGTVGMMHRNPSHTGGDTVEGEGNIPMVTLDSLGLSRIDLIKIDVEGYEPEVLEGAAAVIKSQAPIIFFEINLPELRRHGRSPLQRISKSLKGYSFYYEGEKILSLAALALRLEPKYFLCNLGSGIVFNVLAVKE